MGAHKSVGVVVNCQRTSCGTNLTELDVEALQVKDDVQSGLGIHVVQHFVGSVLFIDGIKERLVILYPSPISIHLSKPVLLRIDP